LTNDYINFGNGAGPWITTVAASTYSRSSRANVVLGDGSSFTGATSWFLEYAPVDSRQLILAENAAIDPTMAADAGLCQMDTLDPTKVCACCMSLDHTMSFHKCTFHDIHCQHYYIHTLQPLMMMMTTLAHLSI
jgi:hypothetical protein